MITLNVKVGDGARVQAGREDKGVGGGGEEGKREGEKGVRKEIVHWNR